MAHTPRTDRIAMVVLCALIGVFLILAVPWIFQTSLERVLAKLIEAIVNELKFTSRITLASFFYPFWRAVGFVAGVMLVLMTVPLYRGQDCAFATAVTTLAVPFISIYSRNHYRRGILIIPQVIETRCSNIRIRR
ncbi:MAG: hypothetical protein ACERKX_03950 [Anaerolineales bacterium]